MAGDTELRIVGAPAMSISYSDYRTKGLGIILMQSFFLIALASFSMVMFLYLQPGWASSTSISKHAYTTIMRISIIAGVLSYVCLVLWSFLELRSTSSLPEERMKFLRKILLTKPINGVVVFYLWERYISEKHYPNKRRFLIVLYYGRNIVFGLLFIVLSLTFVEPSIFFFVVSIVVVICNIILHYLFELYILADILNKTDDEIYMKGFDKYFKSIQPPMAYGKYLREEIMEREYINKPVNSGR